MCVKLLVLLLLLLSWRYQKLWAEHKCQTCSKGNLAAFGGFLRLEITLKIGLFVSDRTYKIFHAPHLQLLSEQGQKSSQRSVGIEEDTANLFKGLTLPWNWWGATF